MMTNSPPPPSDSSNPDRHRASYHDRLKPWVVVLLLPQMQRVDVARFHRLVDAEGHAQILRQLSPDRQYQVLFDPFT
jgi:hypothetical protein